MPLGPYIVDFACLAVNLVVEVDGDRHCVDDAYEARRTDWLEDRGTVVLRYGNRDVLRETDSSVDDSWRHLTER